MNSRADLLRTLAYTEQALGTEALLEDGRLFGLARLLGFEIADAPSDGHTGSHTHLPQDQADSSSDNSPMGCSPPPGITPRSGMCTTASIWKQKRRMETVLSPFLRLINPRRSRVVIYPYRPCVTPANGKTCGIASSLAMPAVGGSISAAACAPSHKPGPWVGCR